MRLIGDFPTEKEAFSFHAFLIKEGIRNVYELMGQQKRFSVWVIEEDDAEKALAYYEEFKKNPDDARFRILKPLSKEEEVRDEDIPKEGEVIAPKDHYLRKKERIAWVSFLIIFICSLFYLIDFVQEVNILETKGVLVFEKGLTPIERAFVFDYPEADAAYYHFVKEHGIKKLDEIKQLPIEEQQAFAQIQAMPKWNGLLTDVEKKEPLSGQLLKQEKLFGKIREGEVWRLVTPVLLHGSVPHLFFNMLWVFFLAFQVEKRLRVLRFLTLCTIIAVISNIAQYVMSGPYFIGFSGVVVGLAAFLWWRQKIAPWEGYKMSKATALFLFMYLIAMVGLEFFTFMIQFLSKESLSQNIANTAHIVGGFTGLFLAKCSFFARKTV